jgi:hydroxyacylglutathione hydrolase
VSARVDVADPGVVRIVLPGAAANAYLVVGERVALVDPGPRESAGDLLEALRQLGVARTRIDLVVGTHEHLDHVGAADAFPEALFAAHPLVAARLRHGDDPVEGSAARAPDLELEHESAINLGGYALRVLHTPGHSPGSLCLHEGGRGILVSGDTAFGRESIALVTASGSRGAHLETLERLARLPLRLMLPGHGRVSDDPAGDLAAAANVVRSGASLAADDPGAPSG